MSSLLDQALTTLNKQMESVPPDAKAALISYADTDGKVKFGVAARFDSGWRAAAQFEADWKERDVAASITVQKVWLKHGASSTKD